MDEKSPLKRIFARAKEERQRERENVAEPWDGFISGCRVIVVYVVVSSRLKPRIRAEVPGKCQGDTRFLKRKKRVSLEFRVSMHFCGMLFAREGSYVEMRPLSNDCVRLFCLVEVRYTYIHTLYNV